MLRLLIPSYPLPSPALMAFRLYLALLEFLLECILTLTTTLFTSHHQKVPAAWFWHSKTGTQPLLPLEPLQAPHPCSCRQ